MHILAFVILSFIWGSTWMAIKINLQQFPPFLSAGARFVLAAVVLLIIDYLKRENRQQLTWQSLSPSLVFGVLNGITYGLIYWAEQYISSGMTAILNGALPFFSLILAAFLVGEKISTTKVFGLIIGFIGLWLVFGQGVAVQRGTLALYGQIAVILAAFTYGLAGAIAKKYHSNLPALTTTGWQMASSGVTLSLFAFMFERKAPMAYALVPSLAFLYLSLAGSALAFYLYNFLLRKWEVTKVSYVSFITPIVATIFGNLFLDEPFHWSMALGLATVLVGMYLLNYSFLIRAKNT